VLVTTRTHRERQRLVSHRAKERPGIEAAIAQVVNANIGRMGRTPDLDFVQKFEILQAMANQEIRAAFDSFQRTTCWMGSSHNQTMLNP